MIATNLSAQNAMRYVICKHHQPMLFKSAYFQPILFKSAYFRVIVLRLMTSVGWRYTLQGDLWYSRDKGEGIAESDMWDVATVKEFIS